MLSLLEEIEAALPTVQAGSAEAVDIAEKVNSLADQFGTWLKAHNAAIAAASPVQAASSTETSAKEEAPKAATAAEPQAASPETKTN